MKDNIEIRSIPVQGMEVRAEDDGKRTIGGKAVPYNTAEGDPDFFLERFEPGAFTDSIRNGDEVFAFFNHDRSRILGRTSNGTLRVTDKPDGLYFDVDLPRTSYAEDLWNLVERQDVKGTSIAFRVVDQEWFEPNEGPVVRTIKKAVLTQTSPEVTPWYKDTSVAQRSLEEWRSEQQPKEEPKEKPRDGWGFVEMAEKRLELAKRKAG